MFYVYVLRDVTAEKYYIGYSSNLRNRIADHRSKRVTTTKGGSYILIYYEAYI